MDNKSEKKPETRPFGLDFLQTLPEEELAEVSGGGTFHTNFISLPSPRFPKGDRG